MAHSFRGFSPWVAGFIAFRIILVVRRGEQKLFTSWLPRVCVEGFLFLPLLLHSGTQSVRRCHPNTGLISPSHQVAVTYQSPLKTPSHDIWECALLISQVPVKPIELAIKSNHHKQVDFKAMYLSFLIWERGVIAVPGH